MWPIKGAPFLFQEGVQIQIHHHLIICLLFVSLQSIASTPVKRDVLLKELLSDGDDFEPTISQVNNQTSSSTSYKHKYLPFRVKIFNESETNASPLPSLDPRQPDPLLIFESPLQIGHFFSCTISYQRFSRYHHAPPKDPYEDALNENVTRFVDKPVPLQVQVTGLACDLVSLSLIQLSHKRNVTHLILRQTSVRDLGRQYFASAHLYALQRIDILYNSQLTSIDQKVFDELPRLEVLRILDCPKLGLFHRQALVGAKTLRQFLWSSNSVLDSSLFINLTRATARHTVPALEQLRISSSTSEPSTPHFDLKLTKDDLIQLRQLDSLHLVGLNLRFIHPMTFTFLAALNTLNLSRNPRLPLENLIHLFTTLSKIAKSLKLECIDLSGSLISRTFPKPVLAPIGQLRVSSLTLESINLHSIFVADVPRMPHLERLILDHNPVSFIQDNAFDALEHLEYLSLRGNTLKTLRSELFYNLPHLSHLDLSGNPNLPPSSLEIEPKTFVGLNLRILNLSYRFLHPLPGKVFLGLFKTEELHLRGTGLRSIEYLTFFFLKSLRLLDLSENPGLIESLRESHDDSFFGLESIEQIRMSACNLTAADLHSVTGIFARIHENVQELDLSSNLIEHLNSNQFSQFRDLRSLNLSANQIHPWRNGSVFSQNTVLFQLDLSSNSLDGLSSSMMEDMYRMGNLSFGNNPLLCDCSQEIFNGNWIQSTLDKSLVYMDTQNPLLSENQYYCLPPENGTHQNLQSFSRACIRRLAVGASAAAILVNSYLVILFTLVIFLISFTILLITAVYYAELNQILASRGFWNSKRPNASELDSASYEYDAFVSYNVADSEWIFTQLVQNIERVPADSSNPNSGSSGPSQRVRLCVYDRDFIAGRPISECILESIRQSRRVLLVVSNAFIRSPWCSYETDLAHHHNALLNQSEGVDGLVLLKLEPLDPGLTVPVQLQFLLQTRIYLEWNDDPEKQAIFWKKLRVALGIQQADSKTEANKPVGSKWKRLKSKLSQLVEDLLNWPDPSSGDSTESQQPEIPQVNSKKKRIIKGKSRRRLAAADAIPDDNPVEIQCIKYQEKVIEKEGEEICDVPNVAQL